MPAITNSTTGKVASRDVKTKLVYAAPGTKPGRRIIAPGDEFSTGEFESRDVTIRDARALDTKYDLDTQGFMLVSHTTKVSNIITYTLAMFNRLNQGNRFHQKRGHQ